MYATYKDYTEIYYGDVLTDDNADRWLDRASDFVDKITFGRLQTAYPTDEQSDIYIKKSVCAVAEALYLIDAQKKAGAAQIGADGSYKNPVASVSSGRESISYALSGGSTVYAAAAASKAAADSYTMSIAAEYLANVADANGTNLLYAGVDPFV